MGAGEGVLHKIILGEKKSGVVGAGGGVYQKSLFHMKDTPWNYAPS